MRNVQAEEALSQVPFFTDLNRRDLRRLASLTIPRQFDKGAEILREGAVGLGLFLLSAGRVEVFKTEGGRRRRLAVLGPGDVLGEMALIDEKPRSASAVALEDTSALLLSRDSFRTVVKKSPEVAWALVPELAQRLRQADENLVAAEAPAGDAGLRPDDPATRLSNAADSGDESEPEQKAPESVGEDDSAGSRSGPTGRRSQSLAGGGLAEGLVRCGLAGVGGSLRVAGTFVSSMVDTVDPSADKTLLQHAAKIPLGAWNATFDSMREAAKIPRSMLDELWSEPNDPGAA